jgi:hypothetical protein
MTKTMKGTKPMGMMRKETRTGTKRNEKTTKQKSAKMTKRRKKNTKKRGPQISIKSMIISVTFYL